MIRFLIKPEVQQPLQEKPAAARSLFRTRTLWKNWELYLLILPVVVYYIIFHYVPMYGVQIAFKDFIASKGITDSPWVGFKHFERFLTATILKD